MKRSIIIILLALLTAGCQYASDPGQSAVPSEPTTVPVLTTAPEEETAPNCTTSETAPEAAQPETQPEFDPYVIADSMSLEALVGQIFLARCPSKNAVSDITEYQLGGYVLFGKDFRYESSATVRRTISKYQDAADIPLLIAVDEEGGTVTRISSYPQYRLNPFPSPRELYDQGGLELILSTEKEKCQLLKGLGINVNLAPVCDISTDPDAFMYKRSLGQSPEITSDFIAAMCETMAREQIGSVLKHFPGYGNNEDTHVGIAVDKRSLDVLESADLIPFQAGINAGCGAVMVSHTIVESIDPSRPASLSPEVNSYLRQQMGFQGVIMTDDLVMEAITDLYGAGESAVLAVLAGNDVLCSSEYQLQYAAVLEAAKNGRISRTRLTESVARILQWKCDLGLLAL